MLAATPDRRRRPSDGLVVKASILARLLRIRLLTLEATVVIAPADVTAPSPASPGVGARRPSTRPPRALPARSAATASGHRGLAEALRTIDETTAILDEVRRNASSSSAGNGAGPAAGRH